MLEHLYEHLTEPGNVFGVKVREAWSIECPNHGDAAVLNEDALTWGYLPTCESHIESVRRAELTMYQSRGRSTREAYTPF